jgi:hypothetical protein
MPLCIIKKNTFVDGDETKLKADDLKRHCWFSRLDISTVLVKHSKYVETHTAS